MFDMSSSSNNTFTDSVRQEFCWACALHGLIPESAIEVLLGEITYQSLPEGGKWVKEKLVNECMADSERIYGLINELEKMDGNVGAVCQALVEVSFVNINPMSLGNLSSLGLIGDYSAMR
jgi:mediator of RNA polymerase II transcription subunit 5